MTSLTGCRQQRLENAPPAAEWLCSPLPRRCQGLFQIGQDVIDMLDANRQPHQIFANPSLGQFRRRQLAMSGGRRVAGQRFSVADVDQSGDQLQGIDEPGPGQPDPFR